MKNLKTFDDFINESELNESKFIAFWQGKQYEIEGKDLWDAKQKAITQLKVPKSKVGLLAVVSQKSQDAGDFRFESENIDYTEEELFEGDEVSVDVALSKENKKALKNAMENHVLGIDSISFKKDGTIAGKRGYFYRHGQTPEKTAIELKSSLAAAGIEIEVIDSYDDFKPWPKDSNFIVIFKIK